MSSSTSSAPSFATALHKVPTWPVLAAYAATSGMLVIAALLRLQADQWQALPYAAAIFALWLALGSALLWRALRPSSSYAQHYHLHDPVERRLSAPTQTTPWELHAFWGNPGSNPRASTSVADLLWFTPSAPMQTRPQAAAAQMCTDSGSTTVLQRPHARPTSLFGAYQAS